MTEYRIQAVMMFLSKQKGFHTVNQVADGVGMSWNTAKKDLDYLASRGFVIKRGKLYALNFKK